MSGTKSGSDKKQNVSEFAPSLFLVSYLVCLISAVLFVDVRNQAFQEDCELASFDFEKDFFIL